MKFYRYKIVEYAPDDEYRPLVPDPKLELETYELVRETSKGYWIGYGYLGPGRKGKWIPKESKKRFAYPTKEEALNNFIRRTKRRAEILSWQLTCCKMGIDLAKNLKIT